MILNAVVCCEVPRRSLLAEIARPLGVRIGAVLYPSAYFVVPDGASVPMKEHCQPYSQGGFLPPLWYGPAN